MNERRCSAIEDACMWIVRHDTAQRKTSKTSSDVSHSMRYSNISLVVNKLSLSLSNQWIPRTQQCFRSPSVSLAECTTDSCWMSKPPSTRTRAASSVDRLQPDTMPSNIQPAPISRLSISLVHCMFNNQKTEKRREEGKSSIWLKLTFIQKYEKIAFWATLSGLRT